MRWIYSLHLCSDKWTGFWTPHPRNNSALIQWIESYHSWQIELLSGNCLWMELRSLRLRLCWLAHVLCLLAHLLCFGFDLNYSVVFSESGNGCVRLWKSIAFDFGLVPMCVNWFWGYIWVKYILKECYKP